MVNPLTYDVLNHEIWPTIICGSSVHHTGDVRVAADSRMELCFMLELANDLLRIHAGFDNFDSHVHVRVILNREIHFAHSATRQQFQNGVRSNPLTNHGVFGFDGIFGFEEVFAFRLFVGSQQGVDFRSEIGIAGTHFVQVRFALVSDALSRACKRLCHSFPILIGHLSASNFFLRQS
jgi:hypothetical protein